MSYSYTTIGPFITHAYENDLLLRTSRAMRKEVKFIFQDRKSTLTSVIALFFMIGSACFIIASAMSLAALASTFTINSIYFIGSIFFTSAAYGQYLEVINADITNNLHLNNSKQKWIWSAFRIRNLGYISSVTQLAGTIFFNFNTFDAFFISLNAFEVDMIVWIPNIVGSILFLVASFFAWLEIYKDRSVKSFRSNSWWIVWFNNFGSLFFGVSAIASFVYANSELVNETMALSCTLFGGVCFFIGAFLLTIEIREQIKAL